MADDYKQHMHDDSFTTRFFTSDDTHGGQLTALPEAWQFFIVSGTLYYLRLGQSGGHFRFTKTVLKATTYVTGTWCVVDLLAVLGASNMNWIYDGKMGESPWRTWGGGTAFSEFTMCFARLPASRRSITSALRFFITSFIIII